MISVVVNEAHQKCTWMNWYIEFLKLYREKRKTIPVKPLFDFSFRELLHYFRRNLSKKSYIYHSPYTHVNV